MKNILLDAMEFGIFEDWYGNSYLCSYNIKPYASIPGTLIKKINYLIKNMIDLKC